MRAELRPIAYLGWYPTHSALLVALLPRDTLMDDDTSSGLRLDRPSITLLPRSPYAEDAASDPDVPETAQGETAQNEDADTEAASLSRVEHAILALPHAVTASGTGAADAAARLSLCSTPAPAPDSAMLAAEGAAGAEVQGNDEDLEETGVIAVGSGIAQQETRSANLSTGDCSHEALSSADDAVQGTQTNQSWSAEPQRRQLTANSHFFNIAWGLH